MTKQSKEMPQRGRRLGKEAWVDAAREALIEGGIETVKIERLAKRLDATRAAFYWHFKNREELLDDLLAHWKEHNSKAYEEVLERNSDGRTELADIVSMWIE